MADDIDSVIKRLERTCPECGGAGECTTSHRWTCYRCGGRGKVLPPDVVKLIDLLTRK